jgi:integrase
MLQCLERVKRAGIIHFPDEARTWIFPATGGHVVDVKEDGRLKVAHTGHALRHSFRTLAAAAKIDRLRIKLLMNHALRGDVTDSYANVPALFSSLMEAQEAVSAFIITGTVGGGGHQAALGT